MNIIEIDGIKYDTYFDRGNDHPFILIGGKRKYFKFCSNCGKIQLYGLKTDLIRQINKNSTHLECRNYRGKNHPMYGRKHTKKSKLKMSLPRIGRIPSLETRQKIRESLLKRIKLLGYTHYNPTACKYLDNLNRENGWNLQHAENGGEVIVVGYALDGYDRERNIVVEYDEPHHNKRSRILKDKKRMDEIINHLRCKFYRYNEEKKLLIKIN